MSEKKKGRFFHVSAKCVKLVDVDKCDDEEDIIPGIKSAMPQELEAAMGYVEKDGKKYKSTRVTISTVIPAHRGMYIPAMIEKHIKEMAGVDEVCITFVHEMTQEEFEEDSKIRMTLKDIEENGPPLDERTKSDIDDLIERASKGEINVHSVDSTKSNKREEEYNPLTDNLDDLFTDD